MKNFLATLVAGLIPVALVIFLLSYVAKDEEKKDDAETNQPALRGSVINPPLEITDFTVASTTGEEYRFHAHDGKLRLMYFGYMSCPDFCPATMADFTQVYRALNAPEDDLEMIFLTVDPERDTLDRLTLYTAAFHEDFIGLRAEPDALPAILNQFGVVAAKREVDSALGYLIDHTASSYLISQEGGVIVRYAYNTPVEDIVHDIQVLTGEKK